MQIIAREAAAISNHTYYFSGVPCRNGHHAERNVKSNVCRECHQLAVIATKAKYLERNLAAKAAKADESRRIRESTRLEREEESRKNRKAYQAKWRLENAPRIKAVNDIWRAENAEKMTATTAAWRERNPDKVREYSAAWARRNPEKEAARFAARYAKDPEGSRIKNLNWHKANPEARARYNNNYRALKLKSGGSLSKGLRTKLFKIQRGKCACCGKPLGQNYHMDHIVPLKLGGENVDSNIQLLRQRCNNQKRAKDPIVFMQSRGFLL